MRVYKVFWFFISFVFIKSFAIDFQDPSEWGRSSEKIVHFLESAEITKVEELEAYLRSQGRSASFTTSNLQIITFSNKQKALFKPNETGKYHEAISEIAAFRASVLLKFPYVPPTCLRSIGSQTGSLQLLVEGTKSIKSGEEFLKTLKLVDPVQVASAKIFSFVMGQWDMSYENFLIKSYKGKLYLISIDNANIWQQQQGRHGELPFVLLGPPLQEDPNPFSFDHVHTLIRPTTMAAFEPFKKELLPLNEEILSLILPCKTDCFRFILNNGRIWKQYDADPERTLNKEALYDTHFGVMPAYAAHCPAVVKDGLKELTFESLENIFKRKSDLECSFCSKLYFQDILKRRDEVLKQS